MMVVFVSRSEKKALTTVRSILDSYAERIGDDVWKTVITMEGLEKVQAVLRRNATKNMAVSCHWIRSRAHSELVWIVGNRSKFAFDGIVPIATTQKNIAHSEWENNWQYLPVIKSLTAMAALLHDWGKASDHFQAKLRSRSIQGDPYRHEWISCKLIEALVKASGDDQSDEGWLSLLIQDTLEESCLLPYIEEGSNDPVELCPLPPVASALVWVILSHHRLPNIAEPDKYSEDECNSIRELLSEYIHADWGYENREQRESRAIWEKKYKKCFSFSEGLLIDNSSKWRIELKKWSEKLLKNKASLVVALQDLSSGGGRSILLYTRLSLMLADHYVSSLPITGLGMDTSSFNGELWANTMGGRERKQLLEEHLIGILHKSIQIAHQLPNFYGNFEKIYDIPALKKRSPKAYAWQDQVADKITAFKTNQSKDCAYFVVNMASTGCGKTFGNAKIMRAISKDNSLRYILALGLRTLTLQTGDEYRSRLSLSENDLAVLIGSKAIQKLHANEQKENLEEKDDRTSLYGTPQELLPEELHYVDTLNDGQYDFLNLFFNKDLKQQ